jgi:hypothetical protein
LCSALPPSFDGVQPAHDKLALVSGLIHTTYALFTLGFPMAPPLQGLAGSIYQLVGSFFNRHAVTDYTRKLKVFKVESFKVRIKSDFMNFITFYFSLACVARSHSL